jgi:hypothetical protein
MGNTADTGNGPAAQEPQGAEMSSDPAAQPAESDTVDSRAGDADGSTEDQAVPAAPRIPFHPLAQVFPIGGEESVRELARHISQGVPVDPVILFEEKVLDRRELYLACLEAGREPTFETYTGNDPLGFLIDRQLHRGYLTESQRGMLAARACNFPVGGNQYSQGLSIGRASELLNVSSETISRAKKVLARGIPELVKAVDDGVLKVGKACLIASKRPQQQWKELERLLAAVSAIGRTSATETHSAPEAGDTSQQTQVDPAVADGDGSVDSELPAAGPQGGTAAPGTPSSASAAGAETSPRMPLYTSDEWIWPGYIPTPGVTAIVGGINAPTTLVTIKIAATVASGRKWPDRRCATCGEVIWLTAQCRTAPALRDRLAAAGARFDLQSVHIVYPELDGCLPIYHFRRDLQRLEHKLSDTHKVSVAVIDYVSPYLGEDVEQTLRDFCGVFRALKDFATKFGVAVILPCRLPCRGGSGVISKAIDALSGAPEVDSVLVVDGTDRRTVVPKKTCAGVNADAVAFRTSRKRGVLTIVWENSIPKARHYPYTTGSLSNREIANTSNRDVSHESSSPGAVPAQSDEIPSTSSEPAATSVTVDSNTTEPVPAASTHIQHGVPGASANVGKPALGLTKPLGRKPTVPVTPFFRKRVPGTPAPFSSVAAEDADEKGRRRAKSAFGGKQSVRRAQGAPTKASAKGRKLGKRKLQVRPRAFAPYRARTKGKTESGVG